MLAASGVWAVLYVVGARAGYTVPVLAAASALAIAWVAAHPAITAPLIGARNLEQLEIGLSALDVPMDEFDMCAKGSAADLNYSAMTGGLLPSFAHGMALRLAQKGAIQDVVTEHWNSNMSSQEAAERLAAAVKDTL